MKNLIFISLLVFCSLIFASTVSAQCQGNVYITSLSWQSANSVHGFTSTELDYCAGLYYDPANQGNFIEGYGTGTAILGTSYTEGYADSVPAELNFDSFAPISNGSYTTNGNHYVIAYYQVYVPVYYDYYWYDPFGLGFAGIGDSDPYYAPDSYGYWGYATYWVSSPQYVGTTSHTIAYSGQTFCLPGQQFTSAGQPCSSLPGCESGLQFSSNGAVCPGYLPPVEPPSEYEVAVTFDDNELLPSGIKGRRFANTKVTACIINLNGGKGGFSVELRKEGVDHSIGHIDAYHVGKRPLGNLGKIRGFTDAAGCFTTTYSPAFISGKTKVIATILGATGSAWVSVKVNNLATLLRGTNYRLNGSSSPDDCDAPQCTQQPDYMSKTNRLAHPDNHFVVASSIPFLKKIADDYEQQFYPSGNISPADMITYNDASLIWGGKFDGEHLNWFNRGWHKEHREGKNIDLKTNNIHSRFADLRQIVNRNNFGILRHKVKAPHFHLYWGQPTYYREIASTVPQDGIDPNMTALNDLSVTPSNLASNAAETIFERTITQDEYELWNLQLVNAKSQGSAAFLHEVKTFYKQLFTSQEYTLRQRNDGQFVGDVFASYLFREPTEAELSHWTGYLLNLGGGLNEPTEPDLSKEYNPETRSGTTSPALSQTERRQMFLSYFETLPQFVNMVESVVNDTYSEPVQ